LFRGAGYLVVLDWEQDESFLVLDEERFFHFVIFLGLFLDLVDDMFFPGEDGGVVFLSSAGTREFLLESRDGEVSFGTDVHF
jgi:hypothetical protein